MDFLPLLVLLAVAAYLLKTKDQKKRITLLAQHLGKYPIEKLMETVMTGYARALSETVPERQVQVWALQNAHETALSEQFNRFVADFSKLAAPDTLVSKLAFSFPYANQLFPNATFDVRQAFAIHAQGLASAAKCDLSTNTNAKRRAFAFSAELFLMQHTCHWFCRSKTVASARLLARHQTAYAQVLEAVAPATRRAYLALTTV